MKHATFIVPTHNRPLLLRACIKHILEQESFPADWDYDVLVIGEPSDESKYDIQFFPKCAWMDATSSRVTNKINEAMAYLRERDQTPDLVLLADDDDLQSPLRLAEAIKAFEGGADWSCAQEHLFVDLETGLVTHWAGGKKGLTGSTVSFTPDLFDKVGGYPSVDKGKDGQLAARIAEHFPEAVYAELSETLGKSTVCLSHGDNIHNRKPRTEGQKRKVGSYRTLGLGEVSEDHLSFSVLKTIRHLRRSEGVPMPQWVLELDDDDEFPEAEYVDYYLSSFAEVTVPRPTPKPEPPPVVHKEPAKAKDRGPRIPRKTARGRSRKRGLCF